MNLESTAHPCPLHTLPLCQHLSLSEATKKARLSLLRRLSVVAPALVAARGLFSGCGEWRLLSSCGARASCCGGFSLRSTDFRRVGFTDCGSWALNTQASVVVHGFTSSMVCEILLHQGLNLCPLHWWVDSYLLHHQGSPFPKTFDLGAFKLSWQAGHWCPEGLLGQCRITGSGVPLVSASSLATKAEAARLRKYWAIPNYINPSLPGPRASLSVSR